MSAPAIEVTNLGKHYVIEHESRHDNLRDTLHHTARKVWRKLRWGTHFEREEFWALRDLTFSVQPGEVVGIVGRNGAGKSTLLKVLSRITEPTTGKVAVRGRIASLLEVGTGFHPDLSGRENIFLNGAILGMSRAEIRQKFDEIVAFAEVERFLDTPVKRYSSGMYVRLAFAVAAHLEPEILIVDEVLAVGDAEFQKKCLGKMQAVARGQGRTVLFVSHNLQAIEQLCPRSLHLEGGRLAGFGNSPEVIAEFIQRSAARGGKLSQNLADGFRLTRLELTPKTVPPGSPLDFGLTLESTQDATVRDVHLFLHNPFGQRVAVVDLRSSSGPYVCKAGQSLYLKGQIRQLPLVAGTYTIGFTLSTVAAHVAYPDIAEITISPPPARENVTPHAVQYLGTTTLDYKFSSDIAATTTAS